MFQVFRKVPEPKTDRVNYISLYVYGGKEDRKDSFDNNISKRDFLVSVSLPTRNNKIRVRTDKLENLVSKIRKTGLSERDIYKKYDSFPNDINYTDQLFIKDLEKTKDKKSIVEIVQTNPLVVDIKDIETLTLNKKNKSGKIVIFGEIGICYDLVTSDDFDFRNEVTENRASKFRCVYCGGLKDEKKYNTIDSLKKLHDICPEWVNRINMECAHLRDDTEMINKLIVKEI